MPKLNGAAQFAAVTSLRSTDPPLSTADASAVAELRRQLDQAYALVYGAMLMLASNDPNWHESDAYRLLDMATDELADRAYIGRLEDLVNRESLQGAPA